MRIYADVLVITEDRVFSLEFKMKDVIDPEEELQAVKYAKYLEVIFGPEYEVIPALVLTRASDLYAWQQLPGSTAEVPVCPLGRPKFVEIVVFPPPLFAGE